MKVDYEGSFYIKVGRKYLKTDIDTTYIENLQKQNSELETQVKQMQNFENCDYQQHIQDCPVFNSDKSMSCKECPYWKFQRPINEFVKKRYDAPKEKFPPIKRLSPERIKYRLSDIGAEIGRIALEYIAELEQKNAELEKALTTTQQRYFPLQDKFIKTREILEEVLRQFEIYKISDADKKYLERAKNFLRGK